MENIFAFCGDQLNELSKKSPVNEQLFEVVSHYLFAKETNIYNVGMLLAFSQKLLENHPAHTNEVYKLFFKTLCKHLKY